MLTVQQLYGHAGKLDLAYERSLVPLSKEFGVPNTAVEMLLFFADNPDFATAKDVCQLRGLKKAIVSTHVERLVSEGLLERKTYPGDRRKDFLVPTEKAKPIIEVGRRVQKDFEDTILCGLSKEDLIVMERCLRIMDVNIDHIISKVS